MGRDQVTRRTVVMPVPVGSTAKREFPILTGGLTEDAKDLITDAFVKNVDALHYTPCPCGGEPLDPPCMCGGRGDLITEGALKAIRQDLANARLRRRESLRIATTVAQVFDYGREPRLGIMALASINDVSKSRARRTKIEDVEHLIVRYFLMTRDVQDEAMASAAAAGLPYPHPEITYVEGDLESMREAIAKTAENTWRDVELINEHIATIELAMGTMDELIKMRRYKLDAHRVDVPVEVHEPVHEQRKTKKNGRVCWKPHCHRDAQVWDEHGRGWCRRDAPRRLRAPS
jgi:hypothetical protein